MFPEGPDEPMNPDTDLQNNCASALILYKFLKRNLRERSNRTGFTPTCLHLGAPEADRQLRLWRRGKGAPHG